MFVNVQVRLVREGAEAPRMTTDGAAGCDIHACLDRDIEIAPGETVLIPTGIATAFDPGIAALVYARSGLAVKEGLAPANKVAVIDSDYRGEWMVPIHNHSGTTRTIKHGERIAQVIFTPYYIPVYSVQNDLPTSGRGSGGFGSTGKN